MDKESLKDLLFEMLNGHDKLFSELLLDDETDTIFIKSVDGERFIVTVSPVTADEVLIELWAKKNPEWMSLALGVMYMRDLDVITEKEANGYLSKIMKRADNSIIGDWRNLGKSGIDE